MKEAVWLRYLNTGTYTYAGAYKDYLLSLPDDISSIGMLVCDQITHPSMYFTPHSSWLEISIMENLTPIRNIAFGMRMNCSLRQQE